MISLRRMSLGAGLAGLDDGRGIEAGTVVTEEHLFNLLGMCADPVTAKPLGRSPNRAHLSLSKRIAERVAAIPPDAVDRAEQVAQIEAEERPTGTPGPGTPSSTTTSWWPIAPGRCQLVIVDEASLAATAALDELVAAAADAGAKVLLVGDDAQLSAVEAGDGDLRIWWSGSSRGLNG